MRCKFSLPHTSSYHREEVWITKLLKTNLTTFNLCIYDLKEEKSACGVHTLSQCKGQPLRPRLGLELCPATHMLPKMWWVLTAVMTHTGPEWRVMVRNINTEEKTNNYINISKSKTQIVPRLFKINQMFWERRMF